MKSKDRLDLQAGDVLTLYTSGGGGYGPAAEREDRLIAADIAEGYVSVSAARALYGWAGEP